MSTEPKRKRTRSTKSNTAELEAKIAELEARLANLSSQVQPGVSRPAEREAPKPQAKAAPPPKPGPSKGTLPAGFKAPPPPSPAPEPAAEHSAPQPGEVAPAYATISSTEYTGNRYYATRKRLSYHPPDKQFTGSQVSSTTAPQPSPPPSPEPARVSETRGKLPAGTKSEEKKSMWRSKGADYENYVPEETKKAPSPPPQHARPAPPPPPAPRPAASGPTHGKLPAGFNAPPPPKPAAKPDVAESAIPEAVGEVAPAYATISSTEYTGNRYYATRKRLSYHPPDKQFTGSASTTAAPPAQEPPKPKVRRGTLPAGFKP